MKRANQLFAVLAALSAGVSQAFAAGAPPVSRMERHGADLLPARQVLRLSRAASRSPSSAVTVDDVGDVDSFGRTLKWLGVTNAFLTLAQTCDPALTEPCQVISPTAPSTFNFTDTVHIALPAKATHSLLCYWFSPYLTVGYGNPTANAVVGRLNYSPTLTVDNPVLADPALIDPGTGLPFGGHLTTSMTSSESLQVPLPAGINLTQRTRDSAVCIAGFLNRRSLVDNFGLTPAQVDEFFKQPTTVHLNVRGSSQYVTNASLVLGLRIIGD